MKQYFYHIADSITQSISCNETLLLNLIAEDSTFVRFNNNLVRQAGNVKQSCITLQLIHNQRQNTVQCELTGDYDGDLQNLNTLLDQLRAQMQYLPADPYLHFATEVNNSENVTTGGLPAINELIDTITHHARSMDLVGIWASGTQSQGFANSHGQRNWFSTENFNFDWSVFTSEGKAVKMNYAGIQWNESELLTKLDSCRSSLQLLSIETITISPGRYRVYLAPTALGELVDILGWGGFGLKSHRTAQTPLIKMVTENKTLNDMISIRENQTTGIGPNFTKQGFIKPDRVDLIQAGQYKDCLVDARSAKEYQSHVNANNECPSSVDFAPGTIQDSHILDVLDTGIYINNLWYCNYSDRSNCRITGMTRYACYWIENGKLKAPINVMRFDESIYNIFGNNLFGLTQRRDFISDASSYEFRSKSSSLVPGAIVNDFTLTL